MILFLVKKVKTQKDGLYMNPKILKDDSNYDEWCEQEILNAYKEAAECDEYLFGDYDFEKEWLGKTQDDVK